MAAIATETKTNFVRSIAGRFMPAFFCIWFIGVTFRFGSTVFGSLKFPFNSGADIEWSIVWICFIGVLILTYSCFLARANMVTSFWIGAVAVMALAILCLSHTVLAFLTALWVVFIALGLGTLLLKTLIRSAETTLAYICCGIPLGSAVLAMIIFVLGILHVLTTPAIWILLMAGSVVAAVPTVNLLRTLAGDLSRYGRTLQQSPVEFGIVLVIPAFIALLNLIWAVAPEVQYDALNYHLAVPKLYIENSGIIEIQFYHAYFVRLIEMIFAACLAFSGPEAAKLWVFLMSLCSPIALFVLAREIFNARVGLWAGALFMTTPLVSWLSGTAYIDNIIALFVVAALFAVVRWHKTSVSGWLYGAALLAGSAVGSKLTAALVVLPVSLLVGGALIFGKSCSRRSKLRLLVFGIVAFSVTAAPTYALTYVFTGNPIFPLLNGVFQSPEWEIDNTLMNASQYGISKTLPSLLRFPFRLTFDTGRFGEGLPRGGVGLSLLLAFPFAMFWFGQKRIAAHFLLVVIGSYLVLLFYSMQYARYYIIVLPFISIVGVATVFEFLPGRRSAVARICLTLVLLVQPLTISILFWRIPERFPIEVALGLEGREAFLRRALAGYAAVGYLNSVALPNEKILGVETESLRFYLRPQVETLPLTLKTNPLRKAVDTGIAAELAANLKALHFDHLFVMRSAMRNPDQSYPYLDRDFLKSHAVLEFEDDEALVYRIL